MTVDASFREQVLRVVVEVLQEFTEFRYTSDLPASGQPGEVRFTYLPEGWRSSTENKMRSNFMCIMNRWMEILWI